MFDLPTIILLIIFVFFLMLNLIYMSKNGIRASRESVATSNQPHTAVTNGIDAQTVAAITAAIDAYYKEEAALNGTPASGFIVRSIKKRI